MAWATTVSPRFQRLPNDWLISIEFREPTYGITFVETRHYDNRPTNAQIANFRDTTIARYDAMWVVYQDALTRIGTTRTIAIDGANWRWRIAAARFEVRPVQVPLVIEARKVVESLEVAREYVVDRPGEYSAAKLRDWLDEWLTETARRYTARVNKEHQAVLEEVA